MSALDIQEVGAAIARATADADRRPLSLEVEIGDPGSIPEDYPPHLVVQIAIGPQTVELLQAIAGVGGFERLTTAVEEAIAAELDDLRGRADTLTAALQAAGPSPERVPPTDPPPAPASSPRALTALRGGGDPAPPDPDPAPARRPATRRPATAAARPAAAPRPRPRARRSPFAGPPLRERLLAELADLPSGETLSSGELQRRCKASQPSVDKALRELANDDRALRVGSKGRYGYRLPTAGEKPKPAPASTTEATRASGTASSTPPRCLDVSRSATASRARSARASRAAAARRSPAVRSGRCSSPT